MIIETTSAARRRQVAPSAGQSSPSMRQPPPLSAPDPQRRRPLLAAAVWSYLVALIAVWLTMRYAGDRMWLGTVLLMAPHWPFAAPLIVLWPWTLFARRWKMAAGMLLATGAALFLVMGFRVSFSYFDSGRGDLRLLTCNVHRQHFEPDLLAAYIAQCEPDVIALQGWSEASREKLFGGSDWNVKTEGELLVASRFPIASVVPLLAPEATDVTKGEQGVAAVFELTTPQGPVRLISLHLASPHSGLLTFKHDAGEKLEGNIDRRDRESERLAAAVERFSEPFLMAGDFNTSDDSPIFRKHWGVYSDAFNARGTGLGYTYIIGHTQIRIDHILAGPTWRVSRCWTGPDIGTAHRPLVADVKWR